MRGLRSLAAAVPIWLALAASASADHHLIQVTEVYPSASPAEQFVELRDPFLEPFPHAHYTIAALDENNAVLDQQVLDPPYGFKNSTEHFLIRDVGDLPLAMNVGAPAAKVCFYRDNVPQPSALVNCLDWRGVGFGNDQSAQRQPCGIAAAATPTPDAVNMNTGACSSGGGPGGGGPGGGTGNDVPGGDTLAPRQSVAARRRQDIDRLVVSVRPNEAVALTASAGVNVPGASRTLPFRVVRRSVGAGVRARLRLKLSRRNLRSAKRALRRGRRLIAKVKLSARDAAGNVSTARRSIRLAD